MSNNSDDVDLKFGLNEAVETIGFGKYQYRLFLLTGIVWMADAMEIMVLSFLLPAMQAEFDLSPYETAAVGSVVFAGMGIGSIVAGYIGDRFGRRMGFVFACVLIAVGGVGTAIAPDYYVVLATRFVLGVGAGACHVVFSLFSEFLSNEKRGAFLVYFEGFWAVGSICTAGMAWLLMPHYGWRYLTGACAVPAVLMLALIPIVPESPRYLLMVDQPIAATDILAKMARTNGKLLPPGDLDTSVARLSSEARGTMRDVLGPGLRRTTLLLWVLWVCNSVVYYAMVLTTPQYLSVNAENKNAEYLEVMLVSAAEVPGLIIAALLINRIGRRATQASLFFVCALAMFLLTLGGDNTVMTILAVVGRGAVFGTYAVVLVYTPEVYPTTFRSMAVGTCTLWSRIGGVVAPAVGSVLFDVDRNLPIYIYGSLSVVAMFAAYALPIETNGRSMPDDLQTACVDSAPGGKGGGGDDDDREDGPLLDAMEHSPRFGNGHSDSSPGVV